MSNRINCITPLCAHTILPETAELNKGLCMPCVNNRAKLERDEYIKQNRKVVNEFESLESTVDILKIMHRPRELDPLAVWTPHPTPVEQLYESLTLDQSGQLAQYAHDLLGTDRHEEAIEICQHLTAFKSFPINECLRKLVSSAEYYPGFIFNYAPEDVRDSLLKEVQADTVNRNAILTALAWIGDSKVALQFKLWKEQEPDWANSLYVSPHAYSQEAGWEIDTNGQRRDLYFQTAFQLDKAPINSTQHVETITTRDDSCPWCSSQLINLFKIQPKLLNIASELKVLAVPTCEICSAFGTVYGQISSDSNAKWSNSNVKPDYLPDDSDTWDRLPQETLKLGKSRSPLHVASEFLPTTFSQIGGHPTWIQDSLYPQCPCCKKSMTFIAQVDREDIEEYSEGIYYAFICMSCNTTATTYQQT